MNFLETSKVSPYFPARPNGLAIIGDMPRTESSTQPFTESFFGSIASICRDAGIEVRECMMNNLLNFFPSDGKFGSVEHTAVLESQAQCIEAIKQYQPKAIVFCGDRTCRYFKPDFSNMDDERGQPFLWNGIPAVCTYHPRDIFTQYKLHPLAVHDFSKALKYARCGWSPPTFNLVWQPTFEQCIEHLDRFIRLKPYLSVDIETRGQKISCIGFAWNPTSAITIPFTGPGDRRLWTEQEEKILWQKCAIVLETCKLVGHNALHFDHLILAVYHRILPNFVSDTMFAHWECYPEMLKSLGFCSSLYTDYPYWKDVLREARAGRIDYREEFKYNGKDAATCLTCAFAIKKEMEELPEATRNHYLFNVRVSRAFQYMSIRGVKLDKDKLQHRLVELGHERDLLQEEFNTLVGYELNVNSHKKFKNWLYNELKLPVQYKVSKNESGDYEEKESGDYLSLLYLARSFPHIPAVLTAARLRKLKKRISSLAAIRTRPDGRIGWGFGLVSTETGRAAGYKPVDGLGVQPQNVDSRDRDLFCAEDDSFWGKADLEGADSWTVAAQCAAIGDSTMMNDLLGGVKPAQALAIAHLFGQHLITASTSVLASYKKQLKDKCEEQDLQRGKKRNDYEVMKAVSHGGNYGMKKHTMHQNIFKKSEGNLFVSPDDCEFFQQLYFARYKGLHKLHERMVEIMNSASYLDSYGGTRRHFFGRRDNGTVRDMLSHLPQAHTSYATNRFIERIYFWSENRYQHNPRQLIIEPVNQVHDETCVIFPKDKLRFFSDFCRAATVIPMSCWGVDFQIPFEILYGQNWGECIHALELT